MELSQKKLKSIIEYNPDTGIFKRLVSVGASKAGNTVGSDNGKGYLQVYIDGKNY